MELIYIIVAAILGLALLKWAGGFLMKLIGVILILAVITFGLYHFQIGPFKNLRSVNLLEERFCENAEPGSFKCECIVKLIDEDLNQRYTAKELRDLENDKWKMALSMFKSFEAKQDEIKQCLKENNAEHELEEFASELLNVNAKKGKDFLNNAKDYIKGKLDSVKDVINDVSDRYDDDSSSKK